MNKALKSRQINGESGIDGWIENIASRRLDYEKSVVALGMSLSTYASIRRVIHQKRKIFGTFALDLAAYVHTKEEGCGIENLFREFRIVLKCLTIGKKDDVAAYVTPELNTIPNLFLLLKKICDLRSVVYRVPKCQEPNSPHCRLGSTLLIVVEQVLEILMIIAVQDDKQMITNLLQANKAPGIHDILDVMGRRMHTLFHETREERRQNINTVMIYCTFVSTVIELGSCDGKLKTSVIPKKPQDRLDELFRPYTVYCSAPECSNISHTYKEYKRCGLCYLSHYCSRECQKQHWSSGHKTACLRVRY
jgi:hypothetical protein